MNYDSEDNTGKMVGMIVGGSVILLAIIFAIMPLYKVWTAGLAGEAELRRAEQTRQILVTQAQAELDASKLRAQAIETIGAVAQKYPEYRQQEFIGAFADAVKDGKINQIIYVPTEANIPIIERKK
jgi:regulator of protease activity HflC (stomatin/prohibitin superfamily)